MQFEFYAKQGDCKYVRKIAEPEQNANWAWFKSFRMLVDKEIDNIREDISGYFKNNENYNLSRPRHDDAEIQTKIDTLCEMRRLNIETSSTLNELIQGNEFIICKCGAKMFKTPIWVKYERLGNTFINLEETKTNNIKYIFACENCTNMIVEDIYYLQQNYKNHREELISQGYNWVPGDFGFWYKCDDKPMKREWSEEEKKECDHAWSRIYEPFSVLDGVHTFIKISEICRKCNKKVAIR